MKWWVAILWAVVANVLVLLATYHVLGGLQRVMLVVAIVILALVSSEMTQRSER